MIVAIDGTGPDSPGDYAKEMGGSFCSQIGRTANATYFRGPTLTGSETSAIANMAVDAVSVRRRRYADLGDASLADHFGQCAHGRSCPHRAKPSLLDPKSGQIEILFL